MLFYIWEPWSDGLYLDRLWCELVRIRFPQKLEINIDNELNEIMGSGLTLLKNRLKIELKCGEILLRMIVYSNKPIIDLEIENSGLADGSQSIGLRGELVGNAVAAADRSTLRYISQGGMTFERIRRDVYSMDEASPTVLGLASKFDQNVIFKPINSDARLDCRNYPSFDVSMNRNSLKPGAAYLRMAFLAGDSTIDSDIDGALDVLQDTQPAGYKNRWGTKDNCQTLTRWSEEQD